MILSAHTSSAHGPSPASAMRRRSRNICRPCAAAKTSQGLRPDRAERRARTRAFHRNHRRARRRPLYTERRENFHHKRRRSGCLCGFQAVTTPDIGTRGICVYRGKGLGRASPLRSITTKWAFAGHLPAELQQRHRPEGKPAGRRGQASRSPWRRLTAAASASPHRRRHRAGV